jgi:hypothetical protein
VPVVVWALIAALVERLANEQGRSVARKQALYQVVAQARWLEEPLGAELAHGLEVELEPR